MELLIVFIIFAVCMAVSVILGLSLLIPLSFGLVLFTVLAVRRGFSFAQILRFAAGSLKDSFIVVGILLIIGCLTGLWRLSGTVAYFVSLGISVIPPGLFILSAFLLSSIMSFALGTSFGVAATAGVILISIARAGGVDPILAAGAILSGLYVGDRGSPASSSGNLVAVLSQTDMRDNVRAMLRCSLVPFALCCVLYAILSAVSPMKQLDTELTGKLAVEFSLVWWCIIPALLMIVLPFCGVKIKISMAVSLLASVLVAIFVQGEDILTCLKVLLIGYSAKDPSLVSVLSGGGIISMLEVCGILIISCSYGSIFQGTGLLSRINDVIARASSRLGRFPVMLIIGLGVSTLFCNQTIGAIMQSNLSSGLYGNSDSEKKCKMLDMENSVILEAGLVPWCIACSLPLGVLCVDARTVLFGFYLWLVPLWWLIKQHRSQRSGDPVHI